MAKKLLILFCFIILGGKALSERGPHRGVGEVDFYKRKKVPGSIREPAILNLSEELESLSQLNRADGKELFFNRFEIKGNQILLFGENLMGVLTCSQKSGGTLTVTEKKSSEDSSRQIPLGARQVGFKDGELCKSALTVFKTDTTRSSRFIVAEIDSEKVIRLDIR